MFFDFFQIFQIKKPNYGKTKSFIFSKRDFSVGTNIFFLIKIWYTISNKKKRIKK